MTATDTIKNILVEELFVEVPLGQMRIDDSLRDVFGLDSVGFVELRVQVEDRFGVTVPDEDFTPETFATIGDLVELLNRLQCAGAR
jgi:acyl carrier protein